MLDLKPISGAPFGAVVTGLDLSTPLGEDTALQIVSATVDHLVLVIREQRLGLDEQIQFTEATGVPELSWDRKSAHPDDPRVQVINSQARPPGVMSTSQIWHTDASFTKTPPLFTILHALEVPSEGGETAFVDLRRAFEELPEALRGQLSSLQAVHSYDHVLRRVRAQRYSEQESVEESRVFPHVRHPLIRTHPVTGRRALYLNPLCVERLEHLPLAESDRLLGAVHAHAIEPRWTYIHRWTSGDVVVWDNASLIHRGHPAPASQARRFHRTTTIGSIPR